MDDVPIPSAAADAVVPDEPDVQASSTFDDDLAMPPPGPVETANDVPSALGKRKVVPTMVKIGNEFVKRQNLYDMDTGERSVFDNELGDTDANFAPRDRPVYEPSMPAAKGASGSSSAAATPREQTPAEKRRMEEYERKMNDGFLQLKRGTVFQHT